MKYHNKKISVGGEVFDSKREYNRYCELKLYERLGRISDLKRQVVFELIPAQRAPSTSVFKRGPRKGEPKPGCVVESAVKYIADFTYMLNGVLVVEDAKGARTKDYIIKRKLMLYLKNIRIREV